MVKKQNLGLRPSEKFTAQIVVALLAGLAIAYLPSIHNNYSTAITFPFIKNISLNLGWAYIAFIVVMLLR